MKALSGPQPEGSIWLSGIEYIRITARALLPQRFCAALGE
jgi:hypothetical protein